MRGRALLIRLGAIGLVTQKLAALRNRLWMRIHLINVVDFSTGYTEQTMHHRQHLFSHDVVAVSCKRVYCRSHASGLSVFCRQHRIVNLVVFQTL